jgi:hypothetical protein
VGARMWPGAPPLDVLLPSLLPHRSHGSGRQLRTARLIRLPTHPPTHPPTPVPPRPHPPTCEGHEGPVLVLAHRPGGHIPRGDALRSLGDDAQPLGVVPRDLGAVVQVVLLRGAVGAQLGRGAADMLGQSKAGLSASSGGSPAGPELRGAVGRQAGSGRQWQAAPNSPPLEPQAGRRTCTSSGTRSMSWNTKSISSLQGRAGQARMQAGQTGKAGLTWASCRPGLGSTAAAPRHVLGTWHSMVQQQAQSSSRKQPTARVYSPQGQPLPLKRQQPAGGLKGAHLQILGGAHAPRLDLHSSAGGDDTGCLSARGWHRRLAIMAAAAPALSSHPLLRALRHSPGRRTARGRAGGSSAAGPG